LARKEKSNDEGNDDAGNGKEGGAVMGAGDNGDGLAPCPFCGGEVGLYSPEPRILREKFVGMYCVACWGCALLFGYDEDCGGMYATMREARDGWNRRLPRPYENETEGEQG
jgi:hypothetical protein